MRIVVFCRSNPNILRGRFEGSEDANTVVDALNAGEEGDFVAFDTLRWQILYPADEDCAFPIEASDSASVLELTKVARLG